MTIYKLLQLLQTIASYTIYNEDFMQTRSLPLSTETTISQSITIQNKWVVLNSFGNLNEKTLGIFQDPVKHWWKWSSDTMKKW